MVLAGITFCPQCGNTFKKNAYYYKSSLNHWGVILQRTMRGGYELMPYASDGDLSDAVEVKLANEKALVTSTPDCIEVHLPTKNKKEYWYRCCPCCEIHTPLPGEAGTVPTYVILMAGKPSAGKSSLCTTVSSNSELEPFNRHFGAKYLLDVPNYKDDRRTMVKNNDTDMAESTWIAMREREGHQELKAMILLRDLAGELYTEDKKTKLIRFFSKTKDYAPDGVMFVTPYDDESCVTAYNYVKNYCRDIPVAIVATFLDKLQTNDAFAQTRAENGEIVKLGLSALKKLTGNMHEESTRKRLALENMLLLRLSKQETVDGKTELFTSKVASLLRGRSDNPAAGFLVQSWTASNDPNRTYEKRQNALDPLIWMLIEIGLLRWTTTGGRNND